MNYNQRRAHYPRVMRRMRTTSAILPLRLGRLPDRVRGNDERGREPGAYASLVTAGRSPGQASISSMAATVGSNQASPRVNNGIQSN